MAGEWKVQSYTGGGKRTKSGLTRACFYMQFDPASLDQYLKDHEAVWPEMQEALVRSGWHNYSLFYRPDGLAVGYLETPSFDEACAKMNAEEVNTRWQEKMSKYTPKGIRPDEAFGKMEHYFYLGCDVEDREGSGSATTATTWQAQAYTGGGQPTKAGMKRECFYMQFDPTNLEQYLKDHEAVWPEMQEALVRSGWHNYSLFYRPDGFAVGFLEAENSFDDACAKMNAEEVNTRWQEKMSQYTPKGIRPDQAFGKMEHYFYLGCDVVDTGGSGKRKREEAEA